jgi:hypothetical protein
MCASTIRRGPYRVDLSKTERGIVALGSAFQLLSRSF